MAAGGRETSSMNGRVFLDTNVLVYLYDSDQPDKQARARALVERFGLSGDVGMIFEAISLGRRFQLSFWDSLILQAALDSECRLLLTEDLQHGQQIGGLMVENPFL